MLWPARGCPPHAGLQFDTIKDNVLKELEGISGLERGLRAVWATSGATCRKFRWVSRPGKAAGGLKGVSRYDEPEKIAPASGACARHGDRRCRQAGVVVPFARSPMRDVALHFDEEVVAVPHTPILAQKGPARGTPEAASRGAAKVQRRSEIKHYKFPRGGCNATPIASTPSKHDGAVARVNNEGDRHDHAISTCRLPRIAVRHHGEQGAGRSCVSTGPSCRINGCSLYRRLDHPNGSG
jgi:hypothetical protein